MTQIQASSLKVNDRVIVRSSSINGNQSYAGRIIAIDNPGREFGVQLFGCHIKFATVFNNELTAK